MTGETAKILIVDDDPASLTLSSQTLKRFGYTHVDTYLDPVEAKTAFLEKAYDLFILDIRMPELSGFDLLDLLKQVSYPHKTIVLTAQAGDKTENEAYKKGVHAVLLKPYAISDLVEAVKTATE